MMGHIDTPRDPDKTQNDRYAAVTLQRLIGRTTDDNENPLHCQTNQPMYMVSPQPGYISYG